MAVKTLPLMFASVLGLSFALLGIPAANAVTWNFNLPAGADGTSQTYSSGGFTVTAAGFSSAAQLAIGTPNVNLFGKNVGETRMGLAW